MAGRVARINYESNYWGRRAARATGRFLNRQDRVLESIAPHGAGAITVLEAANRFVDITSYKEHLVKYALIVGAAYAVGYGVLRGLGWSIIKLGGALERTQVPPSVRDIKLFGRSLERLTKGSGILAKSFEEVRVQLDEAARKSDALRPIVEEIESAVVTGQFDQAIEALEKLKGGKYGKISAQVESASEINSGLTQQIKETITLLSIGAEKNESSKKIVEELIEASNQGNYAQVIEILKRRTTPDKEGKKEANLEGIPLKVADCVDRIQKYYSELLTKLPALVVQLYELAKQNKDLEAIRDETLKALADGNYIQAIASLSRLSAPPYSYEKAIKLKADLYEKAMAYAVFMQIEKEISDGLEKREYGQIADDLRMIRDTERFSKYLDKTTSGLLSRAREAAIKLAKQELASQSTSQSAAAARKIEDLVSDLEAAADENQAWAVAQQIMGRLGEVTDPALAARLKAAYDQKVDKAANVPAGFSMDDTDRAKAAIDAL